MPLCILFQHGPIDKRTAWDCRFEHLTVSGIYNSLEDAKEGAREAWLNHWDRREEGEEPEFHWGVLPQFGGELEGVIAHYYDGGESESYGIYEFTNYAVNPNFETVFGPDKGGG